MRRNLDERLRHEGLADAGRDLVLAAYDVAMEQRLRHLNDEHPDALHPGRTVRILMDDTAERRAVVLAAGMLVESWQPAARARVSAAVLGGGEPSAGAHAAAALVAQVPVPPSETLLEDLVVASADARLIALAEVFDHARHLHQRPREEWAPRHQLIDRVYRPAASRSHPQLAERLAWWCDMFQSRFLD